MTNEENPKQNRGAISPKVSVDEVNAKVIDLVPLVSHSGGWSTRDDVTFTTTWPGSTFGKGISVFSITSGPPLLAMVMAWILEGNVIAIELVEKWRATRDSLRVKVRI